MTRRRKKTQRHYAVDIATKANRVLNIILIAFVLIIIRIWYLSIIQHDQKLEESRRPQRRTVIEPAKRATIRDRYNVAMAINKMYYNAALLYSEMRHIPSIAWEKQPDGSRTKQYKRKEYIRKLSNQLGEILQLSSERIEDLIHSKGALYGNTPFIVKEGLTEQEYYRLKIMEKDWPGLHVQCLPQRVYPMGRLGADIIGYIGAINRQEYETVIQEITHLDAFFKQREEGEEPYLPNGFLSVQEVKKRLNDLKERAYTLHDYVGKTGVECRFEQNLRGFHGKKSYLSDARGNYLRELPGGREPIGGERVILTISSELQEYAEKLLAQNERIRKPRLTTKDKARFVANPEQQPWIKGGAIVAFDPKTGEVLTLASYPRFDPNDFITSGASEENKQNNIHRWFESPQYLGDIWDQKRPFERERYNDRLNTFFDDGIEMTWDNYLSLIFPPENEVRKIFLQYNTIKNALEIQLAFENLLTLSGQNDAYALVNAIYTGGDHISHRSKGIEPVIEGIKENFDLHQEAVQKNKKIVDSYLKQLSHNYNKVLFVDLCRLIAFPEAFSPILKEKIHQETINTYKTTMTASIPVCEAVKKKSKQLFHDSEFTDWRINNEKNFLREKRLNEKAERKYARPYIDYLDKQEADMFNIFWKTRGMELVAALLKPQEKTQDLYLDYFSSQGKQLQSGSLAPSWIEKYRILQANTANFSYPEAIAYLKTMKPYKELTKPLLGTYRGVRKENGLQQLKHLAAAFYPQSGCGYGRSQAYRQATTQGSIFKLVTAYAALVQQHKDTQKIKNPLEIIDKVFKEGKDTYVGYTMDGKPIPRFYKGGVMPRSLSKNLGRIDLLRALETSSNPYFALLASDILKSPDDLAKAAQDFSYGKRTGIDLPAEIPGAVPTDLLTNRTGLYATAIGQHSLVVTPLQTSVMLASLVNGGKVLQPKVVGLRIGQHPDREDDHIFVPKEYSCQESLTLAGIDFPLFTSVVRNQQSNQTKKIKTVVSQQLFMPAEITRLLMEGMRRVVAKDHSDAFMGLSRIYNEYPQALADYKDTKEHLLGKTSTSEAVEIIGLDIEEGLALVNHVWFGGISYDENKQPELVVVVYLRYGGYGKAAAPLAAQIAKKWKEIKKSHTRSKEKKLF